MWHPRQFNEQRNVRTFAFETEPEPLLEEKEHEQIPAESPA